MSIVLYRFEFAICKDPLNTVVKTGSAALMELFARGLPDKVTGELPELDPSLVFNAQPVGVFEGDARAAQKVMVDAYPLRQNVARDIWRDYGGRLPETVEDLEWFKPETGYSRDFDFHMRSGGTLESWLAGDTAGSMIDLDDQETGEDAEPDA